MPDSGTDPLNGPKKKLAAFMRRLYRRGLTTSLGGNISIRHTDTLVLITPSGVDKGTLRPSQIGMVTLAGRNRTPALALSMETGMHLAIYRKRPEVSAIVHAHPVTASAFAASGRKINCRLLAESRAMLREPAVAPFALMGSDRLADEVADALENADAALMENHGAVTVGSSLLVAFERMEVLEAAARITLATSLLGTCRELPPEEIARIDALMGS